MAPLRRDDLPSLLLLPSPPEPASKEALVAAYRPSLEAAIARSRSPTSAEVLVVAVACPLLSGTHQYSKCVRWEATQALVAGIYAIASAVCARLSIPAYNDAGPGSVDVRVVVVDHSRDRALPPVESLASLPAVGPNNTAIVDLPTFAASNFPWRTLFFSSTEAGMQLRADYLRLSEGKQIFRHDQLVPVDGGITLHVPAAAGPRHHTATDGATVNGGGETNTGETAAPERGHKIVCLGGTFDHLHAGHKLLLTGEALLLDIPKPDPAVENGGISSPCRFIIGVTGDELLKNKEHAELVQPWSQRARAVIQFLSTVLELRPSGWKNAPPPEEGGGGWPPPATISIEERGDGDFRASFRDGAISVECVRIQDGFGPTITIPEITSLVVSAETSSGGKAVNDKRLGLGWKSLQIYVVDVLDAEGAGTDEGGATEQQQVASSADFASKISSSAIRKAIAEGRRA